jgi:aminodeoxyfutalosine deaminase
MSAVTAIRARWIVPILGQPIHDGVVAASQQRIIYVGPTAGWRDSTPRDLGDVAVLPALVNAHTHLEFSDLKQPLGQSGMSFTDWIPLVVQHRRQRVENSLATILARGADESWSQGVSALGEISTNLTERIDQLDTPLYGTVFQEALGWNPATVDQQLQSLKDIMYLQQPWLRGLSPHAPYTVCTELLTGLVQLAKERELPLAMHVAETYEELEFLATGQGAFRQMLERAGVWLDSFWQAPRTILHLLQHLAQVPRALIVHGNYLNQREQEFLAQQRRTMSVVYCPRTHHYFGHTSYPLSLMLQRGVHVAIGTDSRASNPDLSLWSELQFIARTQPLAPQRILELGTIDGAQALNLESSHGSLTVGKRAALCVVSDVDWNQQSPLAETLLASQTKSTGMLI